MANRETNGARDFSEGFYFRRARFGVEGTIARDFNYRLLLELGGSGTEGPTRINDAWIAYTGLAPFTFQIGAFAPPANMDDGTTPEDIAVPRARQRFGVVAHARWRGRSHRRRREGQRRALDERFRIDHPHRQRRRSLRQAARGRGARRRAHRDRRRLQRAPGRIGHLRVLACRPGFVGHAAASRDPVPRSARDPRRRHAPHRHGRHRRRARERARRRVRRQLEELSICRANTSGSTSSAARRARSPIRTSRATTCRAAGCLTRREPPLQPRHRFVPESASDGCRFRRAGGWGAWELAARYSRMNLNFQEGLDGTWRLTRTACAAAIRTC